MTALLVICAAFAAVWWFVLAVWLITVRVLEPLGLVSDPGCSCDRCRGTED